MKIEEGSPGRIFVLRLEDGDAIPAAIDAFARDNNVKSACVFLLGGMRTGQVVCGPRDSDTLPPDPVLLPVIGAHEILGIGLIAPGANGMPGLHMHAALGRDGNTTVGCIRPGLETWHIGEVVVLELLGVNIQRVIDNKTGFELLDIKS
jgi:predicted DNA-binding protein with PD1-like motif